MELTIKGNDEKRLNLIEKLAEELGLAIEKKQTEQRTDKRGESQEERSEKLYELMGEMAASGGIKSIKDPIAWQREIRKDKPLYGREE
jgi:hypothetical protein